VELKKNMAQIPAAPPVLTKFSLKIFSKGNFIESLDIFGKPASQPFKKII
jgi:hypothetical protein